MPVQARRLIYKMKNDPYIDFQNDWKIVNLFIGQHDQCVACANMVSISNYSTVALLYLPLDQLYFLVHLN